MPKQKNMRDLSKLSGKPLAETIEPSPALLNNDIESGWLTSKDLWEDGLPFTPEIIYNMLVFLLANPNITSTHLFRADILFDSLGLLKTPHENEREFGMYVSGDDRASETQTTAKPVIKVQDFDLKRTVVRRLVPRNPKLDKHLDQTCYFYSPRGSLSSSLLAATDGRLLFVYVPHVESHVEMPFYHPMVKGLAYLYDFKSGPESGSGSGAMSIHFLPFSKDIPNRLERTLHSILNTNIRLARSTKPQLTVSTEIVGRNKSKDNIVPQHSVQNTYTRLKLQYADHLCEKWVEETEPAKHVFEDLSIAAFLIELWRNMYGVAPSAEKAQEEDKIVFPGFIDVACGNGVLVYILLMEGYEGGGFDARRRKSWSIFPANVQERLLERIYIPKPFMDVHGPGELSVETYTGDFPRDTFIISNHADELTVWTPLMAALACPTSPLPFLAIPCCSHSLSGSRYRYPPPKKPLNEAKRDSSSKIQDDNKDESVEQNPQPASGDLKALRAVKNNEKTKDGLQNSMYGSLTAKTMAIAKEIGYSVEKTQLRIPSTRDMGVVGGRQMVAQRWRNKSGDSPESTIIPDVTQGVLEIVERECSREGGIKIAARIWCERANGHHKGK
ncbi:hypothetical protein N7495_007530 [Penicillium taxi]|uniref:uncharacterized protein n=1 Tax=Penicillium taxi TaxID=168475 RepID=UPI00254576CC|nr:uncharacterized protein N7495_007530 [Penicillium taxi]KAJ5887489.1 hypothetical protein N7495_007530 [Penicillium taxi]